MTNPALEKLRVEESSDTCFLAGCGPSLLNFRAEKYPTVPIICMNGSFEVISSPKYHIAFDRRFAKNYPQYYMDERIQNKFASIKLNKIIPMQYHRNVIFYQYKHGHVENFNRTFKTNANNLNFLYGPSILCYSIQLALFLGFKEAFLIGIDFDYRLGRCCQAHDPMHGQLATTVKWLKNFMPVLMEHDMKIFNMTKNSKLDLFPFKFL